MNLVNPNLHTISYNYHQLLYPIYPMSKFLKLGFTQTPPPVLVRAQPSRQSASPVADITADRTNKHALCTPGVQRECYRMFMNVAQVSTSIHKLHFYTFLIHAVMQISVLLHRFCTGGLATPIPGPPPVISGLKLLSALLRLRLRMVR